MTSVIQLQNMVGVTVNVETNDEPPLRLPRGICYNSRPSFDRAEDSPRGVRADERYNDDGFALDLEVVDEPNIFGNAPDAGEGCNKCTYKDVPESEMDRRRAKLRQDLGLETEENPERARAARRRALRDEGVLAFAGFPERSFGWSGRNGQ